MQRIQLFHGQDGSFVAMLMGSMQLKLVILFLSEVVSPEE